MIMRFFSLVGNSFGCSASGERLVSAARDGDFQEAKALLEYNPRLVRYSTFGVRNSPLHYSAAQGHHEIVSLLVESGVDINLRNYRGQTALMQACQHGHWEVVLILILYKANIHKADYLNGGTALHLAALNGHSRCIRLLLAEYIPSTPDCWSLLQKVSCSSDPDTGFDPSALYEVINRAADGGITALHMAALNGHVDTVQLLLDFGASVTEVTVEDGTTIDLIGAGSTPLHYAACGGNAQCCQLLIARGASLTAENANGWTPLTIARSWRRTWIEEILSTEIQSQRRIAPSPYLLLPLMSLFKIARQCGWRDGDCLSPCHDPCVVCLERKCTVAAEGCGHEFCTNCAIYLSSTRTTSKPAQGPPGSVSCPLCRHGIVSFIRLPGTKPLTKEIARTSLSLSLCTCTGEAPDQSLLTGRACKPDIRGGTSVIPPPSSLRSLSCGVTFNPGLCIGAPKRAMGHEFLGFRRSGSHTEATKRSWLSSLNHYVATGIGC